MLAIGVFLLVVVLNFVIVTVEHKSLLGGGQGGGARDSMLGANAPAGPRARGAVRVSRQGAQ